MMKASQTASPWRSVQIENEKAGIILSDARYPNTIERHDDDCVLIGIGNRTYSDIPLQTE